MPLLLHQGVIQILFVNESAHFTVTSCPQLYTDRQCKLSSPVSKLTNHPYKRSICT